MTSRVKGIALAIGPALVASAAAWHTLGPDSSIAEHDGAVGAGPCSSPTASLGVSATPGDGEVTVRWSSINPINQHGIIFYEVRYKRGSSGSWRHGWSGSSRTSATIGGLNAGVTYDFRVRAGEFVDGNECFGPWWSDSAVPKTTVSFSASSYLVNEGSSRNIGVRLSSAPGRTLSIPITVSPGTDRTATFTSGSTSASFNYAAPQDADCDDERISLGFGALPSWVMTGSPSSATLTTRDDCTSSPTVKILANKTSITEGNSIAFTVEASRAPSSDLAVNVGVTQQGSFIRGTPSTSVTISAGSTSNSFTVHTDDDDVDERNGSITGRIISVSGSVYVEGSPSSARVVVNDNDDPPRILAVPVIHTVTTGDGTITLHWNPVPGATRYEVRQAAGTGQLKWVDLSTVYTKPSATINGLANGSVYYHRVRSKSSSITSGWSVAKTTILPLAAPTDLDVTPAPERQARLSWETSVNNPTQAQYEVEIQAQGSRWASGSTRVEPASGPFITIDLDDIMEPGRGGLADAPYAYELRVKAKIPNRDGVTAHSGEVRIIDTPITYANGAGSSGGPAGHANMDGQFHVQWKAVSGATGGSYAIRLAKLDSPSTWINPTGWNPVKSGPTETWIDPDPNLEMTRSGLSLGKDIYAIQLVYGPTAVDGSGTRTVQPTIFSGRDVYVWPSNVPPRRPNLPDGDPLEYERIATYPFFGHHANGIYTYRVCTSEYVEDMYESWKELIHRAMKEWQDAVQIISFTDEGNAECSSQYATGLSNEAAVNALKQAKELNDAQSEIRVISGGFLANILGIPTDLVQLCHKDDRQKACTSSTIPYLDHGRHAGKPIPSADIFIKADFIAEEEKQDTSGLLYFDIPDGITLNTCSSREEEDHDLYRLVVHEIGHALGLANSPMIKRDGSKDSTSLPLIIEYDRNYTDEEKYIISHPTINDSVMSHDQGSEIPEHSCSPHPLDIMAIYALYQNVPGVR